MSCQIRLCQFSWALRPHLMKQLNLSPDLCSSSSSSKADLILNTEKTIIKVYFTFALKSQDSTEGFNFIPFWARSKRVTHWFSNWLFAECECFREIIMAVCSVNELKTDLGSPKEILFNLKLIWSSWLFF